MLCEKCKKNYASVHYRYNENGNITELHLCPECAQNEGLLHNGDSAANGIFSDNNIFGDSFGKIPFSSLFGPNGTIRSGSLQRKVCPSCGLTENELRSSGKLGCEKCYSVFSELLQVMLNKMHMSTEYKGKSPERTENGISIIGKLEKLKKEMQNAVDEQKYEDAARIRDMIKEMEKDINKEDITGGDE